MDQPFGTYFDDLRGTVRWTPEQLDRLRVFLGSLAQNLLEVSIEDQLAELSEIIKEFEPDFPTVAEMYRTHVFDERLSIIDQCERSEEAYEAISELYQRLIAPQN
jgi:hypothetical protein